MGNTKSKNAEETLADVRDIINDRTTEYSFINLHGPSAGMGAVLIVGVLILMGLFWGVIPRVRSLFDSMGGEAGLPFITKVVFAFGDFLTSWWLLAFFIFLGFPYDRIGERLERLISPISAIR